MSITFKKFQGSAALSQETAAYDTTVLFNGKAIGTCRNDGNGGEGFFREDRTVDPALIKQAEAWARTQHYTELDGSVAKGPQGEPMFMGGIAEYCDYLAEETISHKQMVSRIRRQLKKGILISDPARNGDIFQLSGTYTEALKPAIEKRYPGVTILNAVPIEQSVLLFKQQEVRLRKAQAAKAAADQAALEQALNSSPAQASSKPRRKI